jgi:tricorn protease
MFKRTVLVLCLMTFGLAGWMPLGAESTRLLRTPTVSATEVAFAYANNIWVVERAGGVARRLTSFPGQTMNPHFSPDGKWITFSGEYAGNIDVYVVPSEGGEPKRLTWHPGADTVQGWTPDGKSVLFSSARATAAPTAAPRFWTVPATGGVEEPLPLPRAYQGKISPDGTHLAYRMNNSWDEERRNYRGGQNRPILDCRFENFRPGLAAVDRFQRHGPGLDRQYRIFHFRSRRHRQHLVIRNQIKKTYAGDQVH